MKALSEMRWILAATVLLLGLALWLPLWSTHMEAPQYHGQDALQVNVYAGYLAGDIKEIATLNQYVGVQLPTDLPELEAGPWVIGAFVLLAALAFALPAGAQRRIAAILLGLMVALLLSAGALAQYRLYHLGHNRGHTPLARVADFTPPVLGSVKIENFEVHTGMESGGWAYLGAIALLGGGLFVTRRRRSVSPSAAEARRAAIPAREEKTTRAQPGAAKG